MYWNSAGQKHTARTVELAIAKARETGIDTIVVASCSGETAKKFIGAVGNVVCVTHVTGFEAPGAQELEPEVRRELLDRGVQVLTTTHVLSGAERGISKRFQGAYPVEIMAHTLRMFGQGVKVCVEVAVMALDAGLIPYGKNIIAVGGTSAGADTAVIIRPGHGANILETYIAEIICKPGTR